mgnify:FL=1
MLQKLLYRAVHSVAWQPFFAAAPFSSHTGNICLGAPSLCLEPIAMSAADTERSRQRSSQFPLVEMREAVACVLQQATMVAQQASFKLRTPELLPAASLHNRILHDDATSLVSHPPFRASIFDGYAIGAGSDASAPLAVRSSVSAGDSPALLALQPGDVAWVTTGAPVPPGSHCVV